MENEKNRFKYKIGIIILPRINSWILYFNAEADVCCNQVIGQVSTCWLFKKSHPPLVQLSSDLKWKQLWEEAPLPVEHENNFG